MPITALIFLSYSNLPRRVYIFGTHSEPPNPTRPVPGTLVGAFEFFVFGVSMLIFTTDRLLTTSMNAGR